MRNYITKSVFLVKIDGHVEKIYGVYADAELFFMRCGAPKNMVIDEWPVEFEASAG